MKTLTYAWIGLAVVLVALILVLKKFPGIISYDYYYTHLNIYATFTPKNPLTEEKGREAAELMKSGLLSGISYPMNEEFKQEPKISTENGTVKLNLRLQFANYHDCYMYLLHHRKPETPLLSGSSVKESVIVRKTRLTYVRQIGHLEDQEKALRGDTEISTVCRF